MSLWTEIELNMCYNDTVMIEEEFYTKFITNYLIKI